MKRLIGLISILFLLSGCSAVYNVEINDKFIKDELSINSANKEELNSGNPSYKTLIDNNYKNFELAVNKDTPGYPEIHTKLKGYEYYNKKLINTIDNYGLVFTYKHELSNYAKSPLLGFYNFASIKNVSNKIIIDSGDAKGCYVFNNYALLTDLTLNISSIYEVTNHNADEVNNNTYTWHITKDNYQSKTIHLEVDKNKKLSDIIKKEKFQKMVDIIYISLGIITTIFIIIIVIKIRKSNN